MLGLAAQRTQLGLGVPNPQRSLTWVGGLMSDDFGSFNPRHRVDRLVTEPFHILPNPPTSSGRKDAIAEALRAVALALENAGKLSTTNALTYLFIPMTCARYNGSPTVC